MSVTFDAGVDEVTDKLIQLDVTKHWEGFWDAAFAGDREKCTGFHGTWHFFKDADTSTSTSFDCLRAYNRSGDGKQMRFHSFYLDKPASGKAKQREDGIWEHTYVRNMSDPYFMCNIQLAPSEKAEGKPACMFWRSVPISDHAVIRLQPALPPLEDGPPSFHSSWKPEHAAGAVWAIEGYLQDAENRWSMGPIYNMQNLHMLTHMFIHEYKSIVNPQSKIDFAQQPTKEARPKLDADPANWMDGGSWEGTMSDLLWDEDGEMYRCSPRPAAWHPPNKITGRQSHDSLLSLKRLLLYPDMMYGYYPERLPPTQGEADKRRGVRVEMGGMMRSEKVFRRLILRYAATGEALSVTEEVYRPQR